MSGDVRSSDRWGGRPRLLSPDDEEFVVTAATTRPAKLGQPLTRWSIRKLAAYLRKVHGRVIRIGRKALRSLLARRGITFHASWADPIEAHFGPLGREAGESRVTSLESGPYPLAKRSVRLTFAAVHSSRSMT
ncbi:hypothetical protein ABH931_007120 [Streptacidiphilus sp. MAP12-33]